MRIRKYLLRDLIFGPGKARAGQARRPRQVTLSSEPLEERVTPAQFGAVQSALAILQTDMGASAISTAVQNYNNSLL
jgi:hypothetical protein